MNVRSSFIVCFLLHSEFTFKGDRGSFNVFFKHSEFYEISCDVSLKPIMHINEIKKWGHFFIEHFLSIQKSVSA